MRRCWILFAAGLMLGLPRPARADWMVSAFLGHAWTRPSTAAIVLPVEQTALQLVDLHYRGESFESPLYYGYRISWISRRRPWIAVEAEFIHAKVIAVTDRTSRVRGLLRGAPIDASLPLRSFVERLAMSHGLNFILGNLVLRREVAGDNASGHPRVSAALRVGAGPTLPHAESTIEGVSREQYEKGGVGVQVGGGLEVAVWRGLHVLGEYKFTWATPRIDVAGGEAEIPARTHHLLSGVAYRF